MKGPILKLDIGSISKKRLKKILRQRKEERKALRKEWVRDVRKHHKKLKRLKFKQTHRTLSGRKIHWKKCSQNGCPERIQVTNKQTIVGACSKCLLRLTDGQKKDSFQEHSRTARIKAKKYYKEAKVRFKKELKRRIHSSKYEALKRQQQKERAFEKVTRLHRERFTQIILIVDRKLGQRQRDEEKEED